MVSGVGSPVCCSRPGPECGCQHVRRDAYIPCSQHVVIHEAIPLYHSKLCIYGRPIVNLFADTRRGTHSLYCWSLHNCLTKRSLNSLHSFLIKEKKFVIKVTNLCWHSHKVNISWIEFFITKHIASFIFDNVFS